MPEKVYRDVHFRQSYSRDGRERHDCGVWLRKVLGSLRAEPKVLGVLLVADSFIAFLVWCRAGLCRAETRPAAHSYRNHLVHLALSCEVCMTRILLFAYNADEPLWKASSRHVPIDKVYRSWDPNITPTSRKLRVVGLSASFCAGWHGSSPSREQHDPPRQPTCPCSRQQSENLTAADCCHLLVNGVVLIHRMNTLCR